MSISNYGELKTAVGNWLDRDDLTDRIPEFITLAESRIASEVRTRHQEKRSTATASTEFITLPSDFIRARGVNLNKDPARPLFSYTPRQISEEFRGDNDVGEPKWYAVFGDQLQLYPIPDDDYTLEIIYVGQFDSFSDDSDQNWLLTNHPGVYLYSALIEAEPFIANDDRMKTWVAMYEDARDRVNWQENEGRYGPTMQMKTSGMNP